jgi:hypothetical protein
MGYTLMIGEKRITPSSEVDEGDDDPYVDVIEFTHPDAPNCTATGRSNSKWPSYSGWEEFAVAVNLRKLLFDELMPEHPGWVPLTKAHLHQVVEARKAYASKDDYNATDRLAWLEFWMTWALAHCKEPIFYNS